MAPYKYASSHVLPRARYDRNYGDSSEKFIPPASHRGSRSLEVIGTDMDRSAAYDFLLTFHSNHRPISYRFRDKRRFQSKIANFSHPLYLTRPLRGFPSKMDNGAWPQETRMT